MTDTQASHPNSPELGTRPWWKKKRFVIPIGVAGIIILLSIIGSATGGGDQNTGLSKSSKQGLNKGAGVTSTSAAQATTTSPAKPPAPTSALADPASQCGARPPTSGDIDVRMVTPGVPPHAMVLGGEWVWNNVTKTCQTSVQWTISAAPTDASSCTQVAYAADNPGFNPDANTPAALKKIVASAGGAC